MYWCVQLILFPVYVLQKLLNHEHLSDLPVVQIIVLNVVIDITFFLLFSWYENEFIIPISALHLYTKYIYSV